MSYAESDERPIGELIEAAQRGARNDWEKSFVADVAERFEQWGSRLHMSIKQVTKLRDIASRGEEDAYTPSSPSPFIDPEPGAASIPDAYTPPAPTLEDQTVFAALVAAIEVYCGDTALAGDVARAVIKAACASGWRFVPDRPTFEMTNAWAVTASVFPGSNVARTHCEIVYREMLQHAPALAADKGAS